MSLVNRLLKNFDTTPKPQIISDVQQSKTDFNNILGTLKKNYEKAGTETGLTAEDLFGEQIRRGRDAIGQNANITKRNLARASMASGGDVSGASIVGMLGADEGANKAIGNLESSFAEKVLQENNRAKARETQLLGQVLSGTGQLASMNQSADQFDRNMALQKSMFNRQMRLQKGQSWMNFLGDLIGGVANVGSAFIMKPPTGA